MYSLKGRFGFYLSEGKKRKYEHDSAPDIKPDTKEQNVLSKMLDTKEEVIGEYNGIKSSGLR